MAKRSPLMNGRRRRHRNSSGTALLGAIMPYIVGGVVLFVAYQKYGGALGLLNTTPQDPTQGSSNTSAANTVGQLVSNPTNEVAVLGTDVSHITTGIGGLVDSYTTSAENEANSLWQSAKSFF